MLYVQQSLNPNEEIVRVGHFHWFYTFNAAIWIVMGLMGFCAILYAGYYWEISQYVRSHFHGLPPHLSDAAWDESVKRNGGMFKIMMSLHVGIKAGAFVALAFCVFAFIQKMIIKVTTEICLTSDRLVLKRGMVARHVGEINVDRIEGVEVAQGMIGRILGYGRVAVRGTGVGEIFLPAIAEPIDFRKAIERSRSLKKGEV